MALAFKELNVEKAHLVEAIAKRVDMHKLKLAAKLTLSINLKKTHVKKMHAKEMYIVMQTAVKEY